MNELKISPRRFYVTHASFGVQLLVRRIDYVYETSAQSATLLTSLRTHSWIRRCERARAKLGHMQDMTGCAMGVCVGVRLGTAREKKQIRLFVRLVSLDDSSRIIPWSNLLEESF